MATKLLPILVGLGACSIGFLLLQQTALAPTPSADIQEQKTMTIEIANTDAARTLGLSGRKEVPDNYGMLFVFDSADTYGFWMKDMYVSIDIIWLGDDGTIVGIEDSVTPESYPTTFYAPEPVRYVLETRAGYARDQGWIVGTKVPLVLP